MRLDEKARENLEATERLLPDGDGFFGLANAAASRAYYAAYQAVVDRAVQDGHAVTSDRGYFRHDTLPSEAHRWGLLDDDGREALELLHGRRIKADYYEDVIVVEEASDAYDTAKELLRQLGVLS